MKFPVDSSSGSTVDDLSVKPSLKVDSGEESKNWRDSVKGDIANPILPTLLSNFYENKIEKYIAFQIGVVVDKQGHDHLGEFSWLDFVKPKNLTSMDFWTVLGKSQILEASKLHQSEISALYQEKNGLRKIPDRFSLEIDKFLSARENKTFNELFSWPWAEDIGEGLKYEEIKIVLIDSGEAIVYENRKKTIYLSKSLTQTPSPTLLFQLLYVIRSVQLGVYEMIEEEEAVSSLLKENNPFLRGNTDEKIHDQFQNIRLKVICHIASETRNLVDLEAFALERLDCSELSREQRDTLIAEILKQSE